MVTPASPFFACMQLNDKRSCWRFEKKPSFCRKSCCFGPLKLGFPPSSRLQWSCTQFLSLCVVCWAGSERFASARFQLRSTRQCGLEVYLSIWENSAFLGKLGSLSVTWRTWEATQEATFSAVLALCTQSSWWHLFETTFGKLFSVPRTFGLVFRDQWDKNFQTRQGCKKQKCFFFLIKDTLVGLHFSQFCTPGGGLTKG